MIEKVLNGKVVLYEKEKMNAITNDVKWNQVMRFNKFPEELESDSGFLRVMTPCFMYYIDIDRAEKIFIIRDTIS
jgi:hypothetical protein